MVEVSGFRLASSLRKKITNEGNDKTASTNSPSASSGGMKNFMTGMMMPFSSCWQPDITSCVPQCGGDYVERKHELRPNAAVVSPLVDRMNPPKYDIPVSPVQSRRPSSSAATAEESEEARLSCSEIEKPHSNDVLCGRGGSSNRHLGNMHFRELVAANKKMYVALTKKQKMLVARKIVNLVRSTDPPGRFLAKDLDTGKWYDIGVPRSLEKTSQALREKNSNDYQSDTGTDVSEGLSEVSVPQDMEADERPDSCIASEEEKATSKYRSSSSGSKKSVQIPPLSIPSQLVGVFGSQAGPRRAKHHVWPDFSPGSNLEQPQLHPRRYVAATPSSPASESFAPSQTRSLYSQSHENTTYPYRTYGYHPHYSSESPRDYREHYDYFSRLDPRDPYAHHAPQRYHHPGPLLPSNHHHYRAFPAPPPPSGPPPGRAYRQHATAPSLQKSSAGPRGYDPRQFVSPQYRYPSAKTNPELSSSNNDNNHVRTQSEVSPERRQEWKRQRRNEHGNPLRLSSKTLPDSSETSSLSNAVQKSLSLEERVVGRERSMSTSRHATTIAKAFEIVSPSGVLQGRSRTRRPVESKIGMGKPKSKLEETTLLTEKEGDAVTALSGLAALSTAAFLKLDDKK